MRSLGVAIIVGRSHKEVVLGAESNLGGPACLPRHLGPQSLCFGL